MEFTMSSALTITISELKDPVYRGSVQNLFLVKENPEVMVCETTSGGSVFDVGTIFSIPGSDVCRAALRHKIYGLLATPSTWQEIFRSDTVPEGIKPLLDSEFAENLKRKGAITHHVGIIDEQNGEVHALSFPENPSRYVVVKRFQVMKPSRIYCNDTPLWDYNIFYHSDRYVVPLENIVRFGITPGSSIYKNYLSLDESLKDKYLMELGLKETPRPWQLFDVPIVDFTTKYEPEDRNLNLQEALYISGCGGDMFLELRTISLLASYMVSSFFRDLGLFLWDLKWEIAKDGDDLVIVDTIDTDSIRVTTEVEFKGSRYHVHFNKQSMRDYYKIMHADWFAALNEAKGEAKRSGRPFHEHLKKGVEEGRYPPIPEVDPAFLEIQGEKFAALHDYIGNKASAEQTTDKIQGIARDEVQYFSQAGSLDEFCRFNQA
jgi:phosphoribosylaminoimidazole-succinocarboxamide synthase